MSPKRAVSLAVLAGVSALTLLAIHFAPNTLDLAEPVLPRDQPAPGPVPGTPHRRVLFVLIDGLRADVAKTLPGLQSLAQRGAQAELWHPVPTISFAQDVVLFTGVRPLLSGIRDNRAIRRVTLDSLPSEVQAQGRNAVAIKVDPVVKPDESCKSVMTKLFEGMSCVAVPEGDRLEEIHNATLWNADFLFSYRQPVDHAGHLSGASSPAYRQAATEVDTALAPLFDAYTGPDRAIVVVSDHGHIDTGGHGGSEESVAHTWMLLAGTGIRKGAHLESAGAEDVAPTVAALLGVPSPAQAEGRALTELLDLDDATRATLARTDEQRQHAVAALATERLATLQAKQRLPTALRAAVVLLLLMLIGWAITDRSVAARGVLAGAAALSLTAGACALRPDLLSLSHDMTPVLFPALCASVTALPLFFLGWRSKDRGSFALGAFIGASPAAAATFIWLGTFAPRLVCEPPWTTVAPFVAYASFVPIAIIATALALRRKEQ